MVDQLAQKVARLLGAMQEAGYAKGTIYRVLVLALRWGLPGITSKSSQRTLQIEDR